MLKGYIPPTRRYMPRPFEGEHVHALRSREHGCFLVVQTLWAEKIQSTTDAGSLNTFGRNEIEVAPISSALLRIGCLVTLYKTLPCSGPRTRSRCAPLLVAAVREVLIDFMIGKSGKT